MYEEEIRGNTGSPNGEQESQPEVREEQTGPKGVADRLVVLRKPGNAGGGKGPEFKVRVLSTRIGD
jgi:hypothetical protein